MKRIFHYLKPYAFLAVISPLLMIGEVFADLCLPRLMTVIVDCGIGAGGDVRGSALGSTVMRLLYGEGSYTSMQVIITFGILMLLVVVVGGFFGVMCAYTAARASQGLGHDLRCDTYSRVMSLSIEQTDKFTTGSLVTRMTNDVSIMGGSVHDIFNIIINGVLKLIVITVLIFLSNPIMALVIIIFVPASIYLSARLAARSEKYFDLSRAAAGRIYSATEENLTGFDTVKVYNLEKQ